MVSNNGGGHIDDASINFVYNPIIPFYAAIFVILTITLVASGIVARYAIYEKKDVHAA
ncbi:MAG TPA: hypothetical protein VIM42_07735 [Clostridium sp.]